LKKKYFSYFKTRSLVWTLLHDDLKIPTKAPRRWLSPDFQKPGSKRNFYASHTIKISSEAPKSCQKSFLPQIGDAGHNRPMTLRPRIESEVQQKAVYKIIIFKNPAKIVDEQHPGQSFKWVKGDQGGHLARKPHQKTENFNFRTWKNQRWSIISLDAFFMKDISAEALKSSHETMKSWNDPDRNSKTWGPKVRRYCWKRMLKFRFSEIWRTPSITHQMRFSAE